MRVHTVYAADMSTTLRLWSNADGETGVEPSPKRPTVGIRQNGVLKEAFRKAPVHASSARENHRSGRLSALPRAQLCLF